MKNESLYNKTVNILVQAYFDDTLQHNTPCGCAVGNIISANCGYDFAIWYAGGGYVYESKETIATGYTCFELKKIENAFEFRNVKYYSAGKDTMFDGLMAVIEVLDEIHENKDTEITVASKNKFNKKELQTVSFSKQ